MTGYVPEPKPPVRPLIAAGRTTIRLFGEATSALRPDPDFLIIGAKRGGSTSLYYDILRHSAVCPLFPRPDRLPKATATKGIHYFDSNYFRTERWYRSHLPSRAARARQQRHVSSPVITGEASPYYLFHPGAAERAKQMLPDVKVIVVLRDPVARTHSHWKERRRSNVERLDFAEAIASERERVGDVEKRLRTDPRFYSYAHENLSYTLQSKYAIGLARWFEQFPQDQFLVVSSEEYYAEPQCVLDQVFRFLAVESEPVASGEARNAAPGDEVDPTIRRALQLEFAPHNARLVEMIGRTFPWT